MEVVSFITNAKTIPKLIMTEEFAGCLTNKYYSSRMFWTALVSLA